MNLMGLVEGAVRLEKLRSNRRLVIRDLRSDCRADLFANLGVILGANLGADALGYGLLSTNLSFLELCADESSVPALPSGH